MKKDITLIVTCILVGLGVAFLLSGPLREPVMDPTIGTPLSNSPVYAEGTIELEPGLETVADEMVSLFLIARALAGGPPVAVQKHDFPTFPFKFSLTVKDNMVGDDFYDGELTIVARLDKDGIAGPKQPLDLEASTTIQKGQTRLATLTIKQ